MADKKITDLTSLAVAPASNDLLAIVDVDDSTGSSAGTSKQITVSNLQNSCLLKANNLSDLANAATARTNLGVDAAGTDNSTDVTLATVANNYLSLVNQTITAGTVPVSLGGTGATSASAARTNLGLGTAATQAVGTSANNVVQLDGSAKLPAVDGSQLTNLPSSAVEGTAILSTGQTGGIKFLREDGDGTCSWQVPAADVDTPLTTALRGTDNPHIGAFPNQSLKVTDNPSRSVMVISDADGNLEFLTRDGANVFINTPSSRLALAKGFSIQADGAEPDIEAVDTDGTTYSVISGDTDTKGANDLPTRQGFNLPDIGANPAPILISGGTIA